MDNFRMMKGTAIAAIVGGLSIAAALLTGCGSDTSSSSSSAEAQTAATAAAPDTGSRLKPGYHTWRGQLPGITDSVTLHLVQVYPNTPGERPLTVASYTESGSGRTHYLFVRESAADSLVLEESSSEMTGGSINPDPLWKLARQGTTLTGTHAGRSLTLRLGQAPGSVGLTPLFFTHSVVADARLAASAHGEVSLLAVQPTSGPHALKTAVQGLVRGDSADLLPPAPALSAQWAAMHRQFRADYLADVDTMRQREGDSALTAATLNYALSYSARVLWNEGGLLSLGRFTYQYEGGAHGYHYTKVASFDTRTGRRFTYDDIFLPTAKPALSAALDRAARLRYGLAATASLGGEDSDGPLFVAHIPVTRNVCLTGGGVLFVYPPYEIASFADGEIELFVPFSELRGLLKPGLPAVKAEALTRR